VFDTAGIQTMIYIMKRSDNNQNYSFDYSKVLDKRIKHEDAQLFLEKLNDTRFEYFKTKIEKEKYLDKPINFINAELSIIINKIKAKQNFELDKKEVAQGIVPNPDVVNSSNIEKIERKKIEKFNIKVGDGVFVVDKNKFKNSKYAKPLFEPENFSKYFHNPNNSKSLIYIPKGQKPENEILEHLSKYSEIMDDRRENKSGAIEYYNIHWGRDEKFFKNEGKIISLRKCANYPVFSYTENECYVMLSFNVIKTKNINLKYLTGLLNSKLTAFWLKFKGKMQGSNYQIDKEPLLNLPIVKPIEEIQNKVSELVSQIIKNKQKQIDYSKLLEKAKAENNFDREIQLEKEFEQIVSNIEKAENEINEVIYSLYELSDKEIGIIEQNIK
jgi:adenine-specific DNA-methyltransferase